jgi:serpin B
MGFGTMGTKGRGLGSNSGGDNLSGLVAAQIEFGFKLFKAIVAREPRQNVFVSPISIATVLAMTYNGAEGDTRRAMARALELGDREPEEVNQAFLRLEEALQKGDPGIEFGMANSLWARRGSGLKLTL